MKRSLALVVTFLFRLFSKLRYHVTVVGQPDLLSRPGNLILANHPALIDPCLLTAYLWPRLRFHAIGGDFLEQNSFIQAVFSIYGTVYVPGFDVCSNSYKRYRIDQAYAQIIELLKRGENVLIYPAGGLKVSGLELIGGASGLHHILQAIPDVNLLLVRTTGLWGSLFSKALIGQTPEIFGAFWKGCKILFKNCLFFAPRRRVLIEYEDVPKTFPRQGRRREMNACLEKWFNQKGKEPLSLVSYSCWGVVLPVIDEKPPSAKVSLANIPEDIQQKVKEEIARLAAVPIGQIAMEQDLSFDLGLDSLDRAQLGLFLKESFGILGVTGVHLTTVSDVMGIASKQIIIATQDVEEIEFKTPDWEHISGRPVVEYPATPTLLEGFLHTCDRMSDWVAAVDPSLGEVTYRRLKLAVILFARLIQRCEGDKIGILFPASIAANIMILATQLAGKVPIMINWTLGKRNLHAVLKQVDLKTTISSWKFLDRLENADLNGLDEQIVTIESLKRQISLKQKIHAIRMSRKKPKDLLRAFGQQDLNAQSQAVILFTSGTESHPKGVPLTHGNLVENQKTAFSLIDVYPNDALLSFLPPFHSFGFSLTGLLPLIAGWRVAYMPNPTQGRRLAVAIQHWKLTAVCSAPTFLRTLLRGSEGEQLKTLRLVVTGAESCPAEMITALKEKVPQVQILEGYGITECSPILTLNPPNGVHRGVGKPLPGVTLKVVHPDTLVPLAYKETGLILASGPNIFNGYLTTATASPFVMLEGKKWYVTGDLGYLDQEGYLILSGRLKRFVKIGGEMVSLAAIEHSLIEHLAQTSKESDVPILAVCAVEDPKAKAQLYAFTTLDLNKQYLNDILRDHGMSNLIRITAVCRIPFMPLLGTGKIDYQSLVKNLGQIS